LLLLLRLQLLVRLQGTEPCTDGTTDQRAPRAGDGSRRGTLRGTGADALQPRHGILRFRRVIDFHPPVIVHRRFMDIAPVARRRNAIRTRARRS
jgi:hypothetical protein